jgi:ABC-2 type transport system ATP-binding protein
MALVPFFNGRLAGILITSFPMRAYSQACKRCGTFHQRLRYLSPRLQILRPALSVAQSRPDERWIASALHCGTWLATSSRRRTGKRCMGLHAFREGYWKMIETRNLTKRYGDLTAVDAITFKVEPSQVLGFLGPNGAGKSTTMKMLAGFLAPTSGSATVAGFDIETQPLEAKRALGYLPEGAPSYGEMSVREFLDFIADMRGLTGELRDRRLDDVFERLHLHEVREQPIDTLSKGFKRRVGLAGAILHDPKVLILDEPTDGLDPNQKQEVRSLINSMARDKTIIISTHLLEEVHAVCSRAIIIAAGRILADATPSELEARSRYYQAVSLTATSVQEAKDALSRIPDIAAIEVDPQDNRITAFPKPGRSIFVAVSDALKAQGVAVRELALEPGRLDEVFRTITQGAVGTETRT